MRIQTNYTNLNYSKINYNKQPQKQNSQKDVNFTSILKTGFYVSLIAIGGWWFTKGCSNYYKDIVEDNRKNYTDSLLDEDVARLDKQLKAKFEGTYLGKQLADLKHKSNIEIEKYKKGYEKPYHPYKISTLEFPASKSDVKIYKELKDFTDSIFKSTLDYTKHKPVAVIEPDYSEIKKTITDSLLNRYNKTFDSIYIGVDRDGEDIDDRYASLQKLENKKSINPKKPFNIKSKKKVFNIVIWIRNTGEKTLKTKNIPKSSVPGCSENIPNKGFNEKSFQNLQKVKVAQFVKNLRA